MGRVISATRSTALLGVAIAANLGLIGYFKYYNFFALGVQSTGATWAPPSGYRAPARDFVLHVQRYTLTVDCRNRTIGAARFWDSSFVCFFPKLIAGPIVRFSELTGQNFTSRLGVRASDFAVGLTLFVIGLGRKLLWPIEVAVHATPCSPQRQQGTTIGAVTVGRSSGLSAQIYSIFRLLRHGARSRGDVRSAPAAELQLSYKSLSAIDFGGDGM